MKFSIITPVYNSIHTIAGAIESVKNQTYQDLEHIIIDGDSTDGTIGIINKYENSMISADALLPNNTCKLHHIIKLISERDKGIYDALNKGINIADGEIIGILHSDDLFNDKLVIEKIAEKFERGQVDLVYGDLVYVSSKDPGRIIRYWKSGQFSPKKLNFGWMPPHPALFFKKGICREMGAFNTDYKISADYDFIIRLFNRTEYKISYLPEVVYRMSLGGISNNNLKNIIRKSREDYLILRKNKSKFPLLALFCKNLRKVGQFLGERSVINK